MGITVERSGAIATVTISRPEALNALDRETLEALRDTFEGFHHDRETRVIILTGAGDRAFAAGADIKAMVNMDRDAGRAFGRLGQAATIAIEAAPQPVIAAVNGYALGGGCELALACDIRLASENAQFAQPEVTLGIPPGWGGTQRLPRLVGQGVASELIFTGRRVKADEALRIGLVNAVYPLTTLMVKARELAQTIADNSPKAVAAAKAAIAVAFGPTTGQGLKTELELFAEAFHTGDQLEGMTAFLEKRTPSWRTDPGPS